MKKLFIGALVLLLTTIVLLVLSLRSEKLSAYSDEYGATGEKSIGPSRSIRAVKNDALPIVRKNSNYESARLFSSGLEQLAIEFGKDSPEWNSYALRWAHSCSENLRKAEALRSHEELKAGTSQAIKLFDKFCEGALSYGELEASGAYQKSTRIKFAQRLSDIEEQGGVDAAIDFATDYLRNAEDPSEMRAALDYLQRIELLEAPSSSWMGPEQEAVKIYEMSRESYICDRHGGCSSGHPLTLEFCIQHGCEKLNSYQMLVMEQLSPADQKLYRWYLSSFRSLSVEQ